jgi:hypothetical protein
MTINTFVLSGEVKRLDVSHRPGKRGPSAVVTLQYGPTREQVDQAVQFLNVALVRLPPYVFEKVQGKIAAGSLLDVTGHLQGVYKRALTEGFISMEAVADRVQVVDTDEGTPEAPDESEDDAPGSDAAQSVPVAGPQPA